MLQTELLSLTESENMTLLAISQATGKTLEQLLHEAVGMIIRQFQQNDRRILLRQARGIWKDRTDLPDPETLRKEWDRFSVDNGMI